MSLATYPINPEVRNLGDVIQEFQKVRFYLDTIDDVLVALAVPAAIPAYNDEVLLGNDSGGVAAVQEITLDSSLAFTGSQVLQRAALTGAVTASAGSNTTSIADEAVTLAKMAHVASDRLLGRDTASTGDVETLTVGGGVEFTGSGGIQRSALTGAVTASAGSNATSLATKHNTHHKIIRIDSPTTTGEYEITWTLDAVTIREMRSFLVGGTDYKFNIDLRAKTTPFTQRAAMFSADQTATASTSTTHTPDNEPTAGDVVTFLGKTGGTGTPSKILLLIAYTID